MITKGGDMITLTARAAEELKAVVQAEFNDPEQAFRLVPDESGQLVLVVDRAKEGDQIVELEGLKVLLIGAEVAGVVHGMVVDWEDTSEGACLIITSPSPQA
jgi:Fe-S cluster assembly iron-binding protein IscA